MASEKINYTPDFMTGLRGVMKLNEPMSSHTSWRVGGNADYYYSPADRDDLIKLFRQIPDDMPVYWIGLGSNLLVRDGGFPGVVIQTRTGFNHVTQSNLENGDLGTIQAEAGVSCAKLSRFTINLGLHGVGFLAGVPGSFGGALAMNAGAFGGETWDWVKCIECINRAGDIFALDADQIDTGYRRVNLPDDTWILSGELALVTGADIDEGKKTVRSLLEKRGSSQPVQSANAGSVFRNPIGGYAAQLIESVGLKGVSIGDAIISERHANFIINQGNATASDIEMLIEKMKADVLDQHGIELETEVRIMGESL